MAALRRYFLSAHTHFDRRNGIDRRATMQRRLGMLNPWRMEIVVENDREFVPTRAFLDRRNRRERRSQAEASGA